MESLILLCPQGHRCSRLCLDNQCKYPSSICQRQGCSSSRQHQHCVGDIQADQLFTMFAQAIKRREKAQYPMLQIFNSLLKTIQIMKNQYLQMKQDPFQFLIKEEKQLHLMLKYRQFSHISASLVKRVWKSLNMKNEIQEDNQLLEKVKAKAFSVEKEIDKISKLLFETDKYELISIEPANRFLVVSEKNSHFIQAKQNIYFGLMNPALSKLSVSKINLRLLNDEGTACGIGFKSMMQKNNYEWSTDEKRGFYVLQPCSKVIYGDSKQRIYNFDYRLQENLEIGFDPIKRCISFRNASRNLDSFVIAVEIPENDSVHFVIFPAITGAKIQIL